MKLPSLKGSPKQISWALEIREERIKYAFDVLAVREHSDKIAVKIRMIDIIMERIAASSWIDNRDVSLYEQAIRSMPGGLPDPTVRFEMKLTIDQRNHLASKSTSMAESIRNLIDKDIENELISNS